MKIQYIGHSCFLLVTDCGTRILTDPYSEEIGYPMPNISADAVCVSHDHYDHCNVSAVSAGRIIKTEGTFRIGDAEITAARRFHDEVQGKKRGATLIFTVRCEGMTLCHLGDIGEPLAALTRSGFSLTCDVMLIPVGGTYTLDAREAERYVRYFDPKIVIPMHYKTDDLRLDIAPPQKFVTAFSDRPLVHTNASIEIGRNMLTEKKIIWMEHNCYAGN